MTGLKELFGDPVPLIFVGQVMTGIGMPLYGVPQRALRQTLVPDHLLGRTLRQLPSTR